MTQKIKVKKGTERNSTSKKANKSSKKAKKDLTKENLKKASKEVKEQKTKYIYPEDVVTSSQKKEFRRKARATYKALNAKVKRLGKSSKEEDKKELKSTEKEFEAFIGGTYSAPETLS